MEEIIVNDIDVSGCKGYIKGGICLDCNISYIKCQDCSNCLYKQLKRKEKECEELKERLKCKCFDNESKQNRCTSYTRIAKDYEKDLVQLNKLNQVLQEIKEMCKKHTDFCKDNKKNCELCSFQPCNDILILQIIKEVENE